MMSLYLHTRAREIFKSHSVQTSAKQIIFQPNISQKCSNPSVVLDDEAINLMQLLTVHIEMVVICALKYIVHLFH